MKSFGLNENLGALKALLSPHLFSEEITNELERFPTQTIIGLGQGGGRIAAELSRFGFPTFLLNSSKSDLNEHKNLIPESRRFLTKSTDLPELEGTDKNAKLGYNIAIENKDTYKKVALSDEVQNAEFVWACVSLGGGTGNGALKVALTYLSKVRENRALPGGRIPLGVICSLPSKDERGSSFRRNALAGIALLQDFINQGKIGSVLVIDNEKIKDYYEKEPLQTYGGTIIDAKSYSNMVVASTIVEISSIPLLEGRAVFDKTELLNTLSTPGWLSISKNDSLSNDDNLEAMIGNLFSENEVLANYNVNNALAGAVAIMYPTTKNVSPKIADDVYRFASDYLNTKVNLSISKNSKIDKLKIYGISVLPSPSTRIKELKEELAHWENVEKEQEEAKKQASADLELEGLSDFFSLDNSMTKRKKATLDDLEDEFGSESSSNNKPNKTLDLDDIEF